MSWNPSQVAAELQYATSVLSERGLKHAAKWCAEQWMGLSPNPQQQPQRTDETNPENVEKILIFSSADTSCQYQYAKTLLDLGEYGNAASVLSQPGADGLGPPLPQLSEAAIFLRAYSMFLAGERCKEEMEYELGYVRYRDTGKKMHRLRVALSQM